MNKRDLISDIEREREQLNAVLARVPAERMTEPGVAGDWSVKDVLAHLAVWSSRAVTVMFQAERGGKLQVPQYTSPDWAELNAKDYDAQKDRPLDRILADYHGVHSQLIKRLQAWPDEPALFDSRRFPVLKGESLGAWVRSNSAEHDAEHREQIEAWLKKELSD
jgi:hypothetical protein